MKYYEGNCSYYHFFSLHRHTCRTRIGIYYSKLYHRTPIPSLESEETMLGEMMVLMDIVLIMLNVLLLALLQTVITLFKSYFIRSFMWKTLLELLLVICMWRILVWWFNLSYKSTSCRLYLSMINNINNYTPLL